MSEPRAPDSFDEWRWSQRLADDKAWRAMLDVAEPLTSDEYEAVPGIEYSLIPTNKLGYAKALHGRWIAVRSVDRKSAWRVDADVYKQTYDAEMRKDTGTFG